MSDSDSPPSSTNSSSSDNNESSGDSSPPSLESRPSPPPQNSSSSPPPSSPASSFSPPPQPSPASSSSPPPPLASSSSPPPPSPESSSSTPPPPPPPAAASSSSSPPPAPASSSSPPPPAAPASSSSPLPSSESSLSSPASSDSSPPSTPLISPPSASPPPPPPRSSESDSPSQRKPSDGGGSSPPVASKSGSSPSPPNAIASDESSSSSLPSPPTRSNHNADESPPADDEESPPKPSQPHSSNRSTDGSQATPSDSFSSDERPARSPPRLSPPSLGTSKASSDRGGGSTGAVVSLVLVGVAITLIAIFFVITRRRKKRMDALVDHYRQPTSFSVKSDNYYQRNGNPVARPSFSDQHYGATSSRLSNASNFMYGDGSQRGQGHYSGPDPSGSKSWFNYEELMSITNGFSHENLIGEGGFGCVYKGTLSDGKLVAVKQLKAGSGQGEREFRAEVEIISRVHHRHLVSLVGYSISETQRLLVYEFVPNNTLEHHLHGNGLPVMEWPKRLKIAIGSAKGLAYLHEDCHPRIIHRDIKSANILIDNDWEAQVADFGLAKLSNDAHTHVSTRVMGTFGYLAPEYASSGKLTDRSDVFSFGVVLLEIITGRKPVDPRQPLGDESLVEWARPLLVHALETGNCDQLIDQRLENYYAKNEMFRMIEAAAACVRHSAPKRPRMVQVVRALDCEGDMADLSNGMKFGQSQVYDSRHYSTDIQRFQRTALGTDDFSSEHGYSDEYDRRSSSHSGEHRNREDRNHSREYQNQSREYHGWASQNQDLRSGQSSGEYSGESETRAMFRRPGERSDVGSHRYGKRGFP